MKWCSGMRVIVIACAGDWASAKPHEANGGDPWCQRCWPRPSSHCPTWSPGCGPPGTVQRWVECLWQVDTRVTGQRCSYCCCCFVSGKIVCQNKIVRCSCSDPPESTYKKWDQYGSMHFITSSLSHWGTKSLTKLYDLWFLPDWMTTYIAILVVCMCKCAWCEKIPSLSWHTRKKSCPQLHHTRQSTQKKGINKNDQKDPRIACLFSLVWQIFFF